MRKRIQIGAVLLVLLSMALYQEPVKAGSCTSDTLSAYTGETITVSSTSIGFTAALYNQGEQAQSALVTIAGDSIRFWPNGQTPTATVGHLVTAGTPVEVCGFGNISKFRMIRVTGDATVTVSYFR
jgi:hypothetical protein